MWRNWDPVCYWWECKTDKATVENRDSSKNYCDSAIPLLDIHPKELKPGLTQIFVHPCSQQRHSQKPRGGETT